MRKTTAALLLLSFSVAAQASPVSQPYTFDYFVHAESGPKPALIFGTGQTTFIQLPDGVEVNSTLVPNGGTEKRAEIFYSAPHTVVKEFHDSLKVVTNKGVFTAERSGAKTEVELAAERAEAALKEREAAEAKAQEQAKEIAKLRDELKAKQEVERLAKEKAEKLAAAEKEAQSKASATFTAQAGRAPNPGATTTGEPPASKQASLSADMTAAAPQQAAPMVPKVRTINLIAGAPLSAIVAEFASSNNFTTAWNARERYPVANIKFEGQFESVIDDLAQAFGLTAYMVGKTLMFVEAK